jgi:tripartite-type tricarboxylate transporter receptor subunit TctC
MTPQLTRRNSGSRWPARQNNNKNGRMKTMMKVMGALAAGFCFMHAAVAADDNFYAGKQVRVIVTTQAGADYDLWMRFIAPFMTRYIPGAPTLVIQNMPGAGSIVGTNYLYNVAPRDGSVFGMIGRNMPFQAVLGEKGIRFDLSKVNWIGNPEVTNRVCAMRAVPEVKSAQDLFTHEVMIGGAGAGGALSTIPQLLSRMLGMKLKLVEGYQGPRDVILAIERGELHGVCMSVTTIENIRPGWIASGNMRLLFNMEKDRLPGRDVPSIFEFAKSEDQRKILALFSAGVIFGRPIIAPPEVPAARVDILRTAFDKAMADPELLERAKKMGLEVGMVKGDALAKLNRELMETPRALVERMKAYMQ